MAGGTHGEGRLLRNDGLQRWLLSGGQELQLRKVLEPALAIDGQLARDWLARAEANRALRASGCSELLGTGHDASGVWLVSRYAQGTKLAQATRGGVSTAVALYAAHAILTALEAAHTSGLVHLDLDPEGILVRADGSLLLPEFGLWSALAPAELARLRFDARRLAYVSPEQVQARPTDTRSDLFALGWLLYEWLAGQAPFVGENPLALAMAIDGGRRKPLHELAPRVAPELADVVEMLMQTDASCRFQTPSATRAALEAVAPFDAARARAELAARVTARASQEPKTRLGLGLAALLRSSPEAAPAPPPLAARADALLDNAFVAPQRAPESKLIAPPPLFLSGLSEPTPPSAPAPVSAPRSQVRAPRARAVEGEPVHDGRTAFLRVESALRTVLPKKWQTSARTRAPREMPGKWQDPSSTLFRVRRAALSGPVMRVASWPRVWWLALSLGLGVPFMTCVYLLCRLWF